ncbi:CTP synthase, partial [Striga asiatica]
MITGGPTDGDFYNKRKRTIRCKDIFKEVVEVMSQKPKITLKFSLRDVQGESYDVQRVFIDTDISLDINFLECLRQMDLDVKIEAVHTTLYGFNGNGVTPILVVNTSLTYNIILGLPSLKSFQKAVLSYYLKVKILVEAK